MPKSYKGYNYFPLDPDGMAHIIEKGLEIIDPHINDDYNTQKRPPKPAKFVKARDAKSGRYVAMKKDFNKGINNMIKKKNVSTNINNEDTKGNKNNMAGKIHRNINHYVPPKGANEGEEEIEVVPVTGRVSMIIPDYTTIQMSLFAVDGLALTIGTTDYDSFRITMNGLNSAYNFASTYNYLGTSQWKNLFQFYRILSNDISITAYNCTTEADLAAGDRLYEAAAKCCMEFTDSSTARLTTARKMEEAKHNVVSNIWPMTSTSSATGDTVDAVHGVATTKHFSHHYEPKQFINANSHITNQSEEERWTAIASNPTHAHYLHFGICDAQGFLTTGSVVRIRVEVKCTITVQWREVTDSILTTSQVES